MHCRTARGLWVSPSQQKHAQGGGKSLMLSTSVSFWWVVQHLHGWERGSQAPDDTDLRAVGHHQLCRAGRKVKAGRKTAGQ